MNKVGLIIAVFIAVLIVLIAYSTVHGPRYRVQVCMAFNGHTVCKTVSGKSADSALRAAVTNACADLVSGVTETMQCEQSQPQTLKWLEHPAQ